MKTIQKTVFANVRGPFATLIFIATFYVVDFPLKFLSIIFCILVAIIFAILDLFRIAIKAPRWIIMIYDYAFVSDTLIASIIYNKCKVCEKEQKEY